VGVGSEGVGVVVVVFSGVGFCVCTYDTRNEEFFLLAFFGFGLWSFRLSRWWLGWDWGRVWMVLPCRVRETGERMVAQGVALVGRMERVELGNGWYYHKRLRAPLRVLSLSMLLSAAYHNQIRARVKGNTPKDSRV